MLIWTAISAISAAIQTVKMDGFRGVFYSPDEIRTIIDQAERKAKTPKGWIFQLV